MTTEKAGDWTNWVVRTTGIPIWQGAGVGVAVFLTIWGVRWWGGFEPLELFLYDRGLSLVRQAVPVSVPPPVVLVGATDGDINRLGWPLSDRVLATALKRLLALEPRVIGVDIFRDRPRLEGIEELNDLLAAHDQIILAAQLPYGEEPAIPPPPILTGNHRVGIVNLPVDTDGKNRRGLLYLLNDQQPADAMSFQLALHYLAVLRMVPEPSPLGPAYLRWGAGHLRPLRPDDGGYRHAETNGFQYLPDFKDLPQSFPVYSLEDLLADRVPREVVQGRVVLVGVMARSVKDQLEAPLRLDADRPLFGLEWHAIATSTLIRLALTGQGVMRSWPEYAEAAWIFFWCMAGGVGTIRRWAGLLLGLGVAGLAASALGGLHLSWWLPWAPATAGLLLTGTLLMVWSRERERREQLLWLREWQGLEQEKDILEALNTQLTSERTLLEQENLTARHLSQAMIHLGQGDLERTLEHLQCCPSRPELLPVYYKLGLEYEQRGRIKEARTVFLHISRQNPLFEDVTERLSGETTLTATAIHNLSRAISGADGNPDLLPCLGRYRLEQELGRGAMGVVYRARDLRINRPVAIKVLSLQQHFGSAAEEESRARFYREIEGMGRLQHGDIVYIFDAGHEPHSDIVWFAMEFIEGFDMTRHTHPERLLPLHLVMHIIARVAMALDYCSRKKIIHRDIKPANIMVSQDFKTVKLSDFGIARLGDATQLTLLPGLGTSGYMAPEQFLEVGIDHRADLFSLGSTLYHLVTGRQPFSGENEMATMYRILNQPHPDPQTLRADLPPCLKAVMDRSLSKNTTQRFQRGAEFAKALQGCLHLMAAETRSKGETRS